MPKIIKVIEFEIAKEFSKLLKEEIGIPNLINVIKKNKEGKEIFCASHNYCDPNAIMANAATSVLILAGKQDADGPAFEIDFPDTFLQIWDEAWDIARSNDFFITSYLNA